MRNIIYSIGFIVAIAAMLFLVQPAEAAGSCQWAGKCYKYGEKLGASDCITCLVATENTCANQGGKSFPNDECKEVLIAESLRTQCACINKEKKTISDCTPAVSVMASWGNPSGATVEDKAKLFVTASKEACTKLTNASRACVYIEDYTYERAGSTGGVSYSDDALKKACLLKASQISVDDGSSGSAFELPADVKGLNQLGTTSLPLLIGRFIRILMGLAGAIFLLMFVYGGFVMMTGSTVIGGGAKQEDITKAKGILVWSTMGILAILSSYAIVNFIFDIL